MGLKKKVMRIAVCDGEKDVRVVIELVARWALISLHGVES